jgi:hypothetical protein
MHQLLVRIRIIAPMMALHDDDFWVVSGANRWIDVDQISRLHFHRIRSNGVNATNGPWVWNEWWLEMKGSELATMYGIRVRGQKRCFNADDR